MAHLADVDILSLIDSEIARPCEIAGGCDKEAEWSVYCAHTTASGCPMYKSLCTRHKDYLLSLWISGLAEGRSKCSSCGGPISKLLSDNFRFV